MLLGALQIVIPCYKCHCHILGTRAHTLMCPWLLLCRFIGQRILSLSSLSLRFLSSLLPWLVSKLQALHLRYGWVFNLLYSPSGVNGALSIKGMRHNLFRPRFNSPLQSKMSTGTRQSDLLEND